MKLTLKKLVVTQFRIDFEIGAHEAIKGIFPDAKLMGSRFHLGQACWHFKHVKYNIFEINYF